MAVPSGIGASSLSRCFCSKLHNGLFLAYWFGGFRTYPPYRRKNVTSDHDSESTCSTRLSRYVDRPQSKAKRIAIILRISLCIPIANWRLSDAGTSGCVECRGYRHKQEGSDIGRSAANATFIPALPLYRLNIARATGVASCSWEGMPTCGKRCRFLA